jgi:transcriptional regulator with XRE-family HTH domain
MLVRAAREALGMTQQQLGEAVGLDPRWAQSIVARWESGERPIPRARIRRVAEVLHLKIEELI